MITHNYTRFDGDNVAPFIRYIVQNLRKLGNNVVVLAAYDEDFDSTFLKEDNAFIFRYAFPSNFHIKYGSALVGDKKLNIRGLIFSPFYIINGFIWLLRLHFRYDFDIINAHWVIPNGIIGFLFCKLFHIPLVISLHGSGIYLSKKNFIFRFLARNVFKAAMGVTACSPVLREAALDLKAPPDVSKVIPYGADVDTFKGSANNLNEIKSKLGIDNNAKIVLAMGRMVEKKGFIYLLRAIPEIVKEEKNCRFVFAGDGPVLAELKLLSGELKVEDYVLFPGSVDWKDVPGFFALCDIFVVPSIFDSQGNVDGLPNVILEAMASGKPIIASRIAGIPLAIKDGKNGILVKEKDIMGIKDALLTLLSSKSMRDRMGRESRRIVEEKLNWRETAKRFQQVYSMAEKYRIK